MSYDYYILHKDCLQLVKISEHEFHICMDPDFDLDGDILITYNKRTCELVASEDVSKYYFHDFSLSLDEVVQDTAEKARQYIDVMCDYGDNPSALWLYCGTILDGVMDRLDNYEER